MLDTHDRSREPLANFLIRHREQILSEWKLCYHQSATSESYLYCYPLSRNHTVVSDPVRIASFQEMISSYLTLFIELLEEDGEQNGTDNKLSGWIRGIKSSGKKLPDVVESILNLKGVISHVVMDRLYYRPMEVKRLSGTINTIFDRVLYQLSLEFSVATGESQPADLPPVEDHDIDVNNEKLRVLSTLSHELHTPLTAIIGYAEGIFENLEANPDDRSREVRSDVEKVLKNAQYLMNIIRNSMEWSKLEIHETALKPESFDMRECALEVLATISSMLTEKGIRAVIRSPNAIPRPFGDYSRTKQILLNLLTNAIKYTPPQGKIAIEITPILESGENGDSTKPNYLKITVIDNGIGINRNKLPHIFKEFSRADTEDNGNNGGIGLGLFIAKRLVELQGGRIWLKSQPRKGSRFFFTLPTVHNKVASINNGHPTTDINALVS
jgi:signal transduction histidine kinase